MKALQKLLSGGITAIAICLPSAAVAQSSPEAQRAVVVRLHTHFATGKDETAAGVFVGKDKQYAYFITARHAVATEVDNQEVHAQSADLWFYGSPQSLRAAVFDHTDAILDLGVVYVPVADLPPNLPQIVRRDAGVNGSVHIVGHPAAGDWSVWEGTVQNEIAPNGDVHHFVTTANPSLAKGYSGGPVFDPDGNFLGMHTETTASYGTAAKSGEIVDKLKAWQVPTTNLTDIPVSDQTASAAIRQFHTIRNDPTKLIQFIRAMPKGADLHNHLSGAIPAEEYIRIAAADGMCVSRDGLVLSEPPCDDCGPVSTKPAVACALQNYDLYKAILNAWSMLNWKSSELSASQHLYATLGKFSPALYKHWGGALAYVARQAANDRLLYIELMHTLDWGQSSRLGAEVGWQEDLPKLRDKLFAAGLRDGVSETRGALTVSESEMRSALRCESADPDPGCGVTLRYIYQALRGLPRESVFAQLLTGFELAMADPRVVGVTLAMPEDLPGSMQDFDLQMKMLNYLHAVYPKVHLSLHAGELTTGLVPPEGLRSHIHDSVERGGANRIGHGTDIAYEENSADLLKELAGRNILIEICLTSDDMMLGVKDAEHPLPMYMQNRVPVTLATNDAALMRTDMTQEYRRAAQTYKLTYTDLKEFARQSLEHAFLAGNSLWHNIKLSELADECAADIPGTSQPSSSCKKLLESSEKARLQWKLEEQFFQFENQFGSRQLPTFRNLR